MPKKSENLIKMTIDELLSTINKEVKSPIDDIIKHTLHILRTDLEENQKDRIFKILESAEFLKGHVDGILKITNRESAPLKYEKNKFNLKDLMFSIIQIFKVETEKKGVSLKVQISNEIPPLIEGDDLKLEQILVNLIQNAVSHTNNGSIDVKVELEKQFSTHYMVDFSIQDTGLGLSKHKLEKIFHSFTEEKFSTTKVIGDAGLKLAIVKKLVEFMKGEIFVNSIPGFGTNFNFSIPLYKEESE